MDATPRRELNLWVELTEQCQYKCRFCYNFWREEPKASHRHMTREVMQSTADFVTRASSDHDVLVAVAGGDATAHPDYVAFIKAVSPNATDVCLVTHGGCLATEDLSAFADLSNVSIQFSIPSLDAERYAFLTGDHRLSNVLDSLAICERLGLPRSISAVITDRNPMDSASLVHLAAEIGAQYLILNRFIPAGRGAYYENEFAISEEAFNQSVREAHAVAKARGVRLLASGADKDIRSKKAAAPKVTIGIRGDLRVCSLADAAIGSVDDTPQQIVRNSSQFWSSTERLDACVCSNTFPG